MADQTTTSPHQTDHDVDFYAEPTSAAITGATVPVARQVWNFVRHFLEMCLAMCVGGTILKVTVFGIASLAGLDPRDDVPELSLLLIALCYVAPMAAWMSYRGMGTRPNLEMSGATFALAVAVAASGWAGALSDQSIQNWQVAFCGPACIVMAIVMLFRLDLYTGRTGHQMSRHRAAH